MLPFITDHVTHAVKDDWAVVIKFVEPGTQTPRDITGWVFYLSITKDLNWADDESYIFKTFTPTNPTSGEITLSVAAEELDRAGKYYRGIKLKTDSGTRVTLISGEFNLVPAGPKAV